jgi:hypothetical protein
MCPSRLARTQMSRDLTIQNLKTIIDKLHWKMQYQDSVVDGSFVSRVSITPKDMDTITLEYCEAKETKQKARQAAAETGLVYFQRQPLTLLLGSKYQANDIRMDVSQ